MPAERHAQRRLRNRLIVAAIRAALALAIRLPGRLPIAFGAMLGRLAGRVARRERSSCERHLAEAFERPSPAIRTTALRVFEHLGRSAGELAWAWRSPERVRALVRFAPGAVDAMRRLTGGGRGVLFVTGHVGNWELLAWAVRLAGFPSAPVGRRTWDPVLDDLVLRWRSRFGSTPLRRESPTVAAEIREALARGVSVGVLVDQSTDLPSAYVPFFGRPAPTIVGPARLALAHDVPVVVGWIRRRPDGLHVVEIEPSDPPPPDAADRAAEWTARWTATLERAIRETPEQWVWMHRRWERRYGTDSVAGGAAAGGAGGGDISSSAARARAAYSGDPASCR